MIGWNPSIGRLTFAGVGVAASCQIRSIFVDRDRTQILAKRLVDIVAFPQRCRTFIPVVSQCLPRVSHLAERVAK